MTRSERLTKAKNNMFLAAELRSLALVNENEANAATEKAIAQLIELHRPARAEARAASEAATDKYFKARGLSTSKPAPSPTPSPTPMPPLPLLFVA